MRYLLTLCLFFCIGFIAAQKNNSKNYKKNPVWIDMIKDPNVNYFEAINAYETFWKNKKKPLEEDELIGQTKGEASKEEKMESRREMREKRREKEMYKKYGLECKKFEHWKLQVKPYVQADGHILSKEEQLKMWEQK
ncbi:MAG: hypothetical protein H0W73_03615 [Bacteroidetes bacterium]|nr:hypothetical protein [Bacteroidota bacterium]